MKNLLFILTCLCIGTTHAQTQQEGRAKLDSVFNLLEQKVSAVDSRAQFEMKFKMHITYTINGNQDSLQYDGHVISDRQKKYFFDKDKRIYQDEKFTISVIDKSKEIHFFDTPPEEYQQVKAEEFQILEDSLLAQANQILYKGNERIEVYFAESNKRASGIQKITIKLDREQIISSIETIYYPGYPYTRMHTIYEKIDFDSKTKILNKKLVSNIRKNGKLVSEYKNYTVYDHRKKK